MSTTSSVAVASTPFASEIPTEPTVIQLPDLSALTYEKFLNDHLAQLKHFQIPESLWTKIYEKLRDQNFDAGSVFMFGQEEEEDGTTHLGVYVSAEEGLKAFEDVYLIDHAWTFKSRVEAKEHLLSVPSFLQRMITLMEIESQAQDKSANEQADLVLKHIYRYGYQLEFVGKDSQVDATKTADASTSSDATLADHTVSLDAKDRLLFYYLLDELGSRFGEEPEDFGFALAPIFFEPLQCAFTICWAVRDVEYMDKATHAPRMPLNDFPNMLFWDRKYQVDEKEFEWYLGFDDLQKLLCEPRSLTYDVDADNEEIVKNGLLEHAEAVKKLHVMREAPAVFGKEKKMMMTGCGNSPFSAKMYDAGYTDLANIDYSPTCIAQMQEKYADRPLMSWHIADVTDMHTFETESFDVVIDKACTDAMLDGGDNSGALKGLLEMKRLAKKGGYFVWITLGSPAHRVPLIEQAGMKLEQYEERSTVKEYAENDIKRTIQSKAHIYICQV